MTISKINNIIYFICMLTLSLVLKCQNNNSIVFDFKSIEKGCFESSKILSEHFLKSFLNKDSTNFSRFYQLEVFCALINEEIMDSIPENNIKKDELCKEEIINKIFEKTINYKRELFYEGKTMNFSDIEIISFNQDKKPDIHTSKYKFDTYNLYLKFKRINDSIIYELKIFEVYHINYKWFILEPNFEVL